MNTTDSFTYNNEVVGGAAPSHLTEVLSHYMFVTTQDDAEFVVRFAVRVNPSGNAVTDFNALNAACQAIETTLRQRYAKLTINWAGANAVETFDPDVNAGSFPSSGFDQEPQLRKLSESEFPHSGEARGYEFRVRLSQYPNYTDAFGPANGRRQVDVQFHYDVDQRLVVTMTGVWTQVPTKLARAQFLAAIDGNGGYAAYRLNLINTTVPGQNGDTWTLTRREESDPNNLSTLRFSREYQQHVNGRRISVVDVAFGESAQRLITVRGTYLRTVAGGGVYGGTAQGALENFQDPTNGGRAYAENTQLPGLGTGQGGPLTFNQNVELLREPVVTVNEQDDRCDYVLVYRELLTKQSAAAGNFLKDPNIFGDSMIFAVRYNEVNDSPGAPPASSVQGPVGSILGGSVQGRLQAVQGVNPVPVGVATGTAPGGGTSSFVIKPAELLVHYEASLAKSVTDLDGYWSSEILPQLLKNFVTIFQLSGAELVDMSVSPDPTSNKLVADVHIRAYFGGPILFVYALGILDDLGVRVDPAWTGNPHEYLVQTALPKSVMTRRIEAIYVANSSFDIDAFKTPPSQVGWVVLTQNKPATVSRLLGVPNQGVPQTTLTYAVLEEVLIFVAKNVGQAGGAQATPNPAGSGGSSSFNAPDPVPARTATGVDASGNPLAR